MYVVTKCVPTVYKALLCHANPIQSFPAPWKHEMGDESVPSVLQACLSACMADDGSELTLTCREGKKFRLSTEVARASSPFFAGALESGMQEAGNREIILEDVPCRVMQAMVAAMLLSKQQRDSMHHIQLFREIKAEDLFGMLQLGLRLLMPWAGVSAASSAIQESKDPDLLLGIVSRKDMFVGTDEEANWGHVFDATIQRIAAHAEEAVTWPLFGSTLSMDAVELIMEHVPEGDWSKEENVCLASQSPSPFTRNTSANANGIFFHIASRPGGEYVAFANLSEKEGSSPSVVKMGRSEVSNVDCMVVNRANIGSNDCKLWSDLTISTGASTGLSNFLAGRTPEERARFLHRDGTFHLSFKTRMSKQHRQCVALVRLFQARFVLYT